MYENAHAGISGCYAGGLPSWVRVLIASRPSTSVRDSLRVPVHTIDVNARMNDFELMNPARCVDEARMSCIIGTMERTSFMSMLDGLLNDPS